MKIYRCDNCAKDKEYPIIEIRGIHAGHHFCSKDCFWEWTRKAHEVDGDPFDRNLDPRQELKRTTKSFVEP